MRFKHLLIRNFRNFHSIEMVPGERINVLFGENAQGKTNFLETIYTLTHGRSFRTSDAQNLLRQSETQVSDFTAIDALVEKNNLLFKTQFTLSGKDKRLSVNDKKISTTALRKEFSTVLFSPESLSVIKNSDRERRDLLDDLLLSVFHQKTKVLDDFKRALKQRNKLLKDFKEGTLDINSENVAFLDTLTQSYLKISTDLVVLRLAALERMKDSLHEALCFVFQDENVEIAVEYVISGNIFQECKPEEIYNAMYNRWQQLKTAEIKSGLSLVGPHKHDVCIVFNGKDARFFCSQGQQRLIVLAFKMAQIRLHYAIHGIYPILLLDDVLSEIDEKKRMKLIEYLETVKAQIFITTTESTVLRYLNSKILSVFEVEKGLIRNVNGNEDDMSIRRF